MKFNNIKIKKYRLIYIDDNLKIYLLIMKNVLIIKIKSNFHFMENKLHLLFKMKKNLELYQKII